MTTQTGEVFISYSYDSEEHEQWVYNLYISLRDNGVNAMFDKVKFTLGKPTAMDMENAFMQAERVLCICTDKYIRRVDEAVGGAGYEGCIIKKELVKISNTSKFIPVIRNVVGSNKTPNCLDGRYWVDLSDGKRYDSQFETLLRHLLDSIEIPLLGSNPFPPPSPRHTSHENETAPNESRIPRRSSPGRLAFLWSHIKAWRQTTPVHISVIAVVLLVAIAGLFARFQVYEWAQNTLGEMYQYGWGVTKDYEEAVRWYKEAAKQGNSLAQNNLGWMYQNGLGLTQDYVEAVRWYRKAAERGNAEAQNNLGYMYQYGLGVLHDYAEALRWYTKAAEQGNAEAQYRLGWMYQNGWGVAKDYEEAVKRYKYAAKQGNSLAQNTLGWMYQNGWGLTKDYAEALRWYTKAAEQGNAQAENNLGCMYQNGWGVPEDYGRAVIWFTKAASSGYATAQDNLGVMYRDGQGVPRDHKKAVMWFRKAAEQGNAEAQNNLGWMYQNGWGVTKNSSEMAK
jgi:TPR repeat protein